MRRRLVFLFLLLLIATGCDSRRYRVRDTSGQDWFTEARRSALDGRGVSDTTLGILRRREMLDLMRTDAEEVARLLDVEMRQTKQRSLALAIAEIAHTRTRDAPDPNRNALGTTLRYSYAYLFDPALEPVPDRFDIRFRWACDLYNRTLGDFVRFSSDNRELREVSLEWIGGSTTANPGRIQIEGDLTDYEDIQVAYDYEIEGLPAPLRFEGLGAPCVLIHRTEDLAESAPRHRMYLSSHAAFPATFLVRFPDDASILDEPSAKATYEILDPTLTVSVRIAGRAVPLEIDLTTPVVYSLARRADQSPGIKALFRSDVWAEQGGLYTLQPLREDRIPVVLIHGLASDPFTWIPLYNDLMANEKIRTRFQFLLWFYPTGQPVIISASQLRQTLLASHKALQEDGPHPALDAMVLCGHSLGGVLAHYLVIDPGTALEEAVMRIPIDETPLSDTDKNRLREVLLFDSLPFVNRVIFYAAPHRGAPNAKKGVFEWLAGFIRLPGELTGTYGRVRRYLEPFARKGMGTSLASLDSDAPAVTAMNAIPIAPHVTYHSIIANSKVAGSEGGDDGFVLYGSSHIDGAASEVILKSGHSVQHKPLAARETLRILLEHLAAFDAAQKSKK